LREPHHQLGDLAVVFPNRRAGLFFRQYLQEHLDQPVWAPKVMNIVDFIVAHHHLEVPDRWSLVLDLYRSFHSVTGVKESIDKFYFWGEMLLKDFDEVDRFMVDADQLFKYLADWKALESSLEYLSEAQKELILSFWKNFRDRLSPEQEQFISVWKFLLKVYKEYRDRLIKTGRAYEGLIYRLVAEKMDDGEFVKPFNKVIFAGFNALSKAEEEIITWYVREREARVFWDIDDYYFKNERNEAGYFFRDFIRRNPTLAGTFDANYGSNIALDPKKKLEVIGAPLNIGEIQTAADILADRLEGDEEEWAVVLPEEKLLLPLLNSLPENVRKVNVTMGYPLRQSLVHGFVLGLLELQYLRPDRGVVFYYKTSLKILEHPFMERLGIEQARIAVQAIKKHNKIFLTWEELCGGNPFLQRIFNYKNDAFALIDFVLDLLQLLAQEENDPIQLEFIYNYYLSFNRMKDLLQTGELEVEVKSLLKLFRQLMFNHRLPFEGEPLEGVQMMGILETRNLDFKNVIILSMNEGVFPPGRGVGNSFIPYNIRKAYELPTQEHQESIYAYLFYRIFQKAENIFLIYNTQGEDGRAGERSRYIRQLNAESDLQWKEKVISTNVVAGEPTVIEIHKSPQIIAKLDRYTHSTADGGKLITPSAINTYLDCRLRFYFRYVQGIYEEEEVREDMDPMAFGLIFHDTMELAYAPFLKSGKKVVAKPDIVAIEKNLDRLIDQAFGKQFSHGTGMKIEYRGQHAIAREIVKKMALKVLDFDKNFAPFEIIGLEKAFTRNTQGGVDNSVPVEFTVDDKRKIAYLGGYIDRIDQKANVIRVLDYKTGRDEKKFNSIESLFDRTDETRNKAVFQTFYYGMLFQKSHPEFKGKVQAGLFNIRELFQKDFNYLLIDAGDKKNKKLVEDITPYMSDFMLNLEVLMREIFNPDVKFDQTEDRRKCQFCPYAGICNR